MTIAESLSRAFARTWEMYRSAINDIPEEHWRSGDDGYLIPARLAYHVFEAAEFLSGKTPKGFEWGHRFGADWEGATTEQLPTKEQALAYLEEVQERVDAWLRGMSDPDLLSTDSEFLWTEAVSWIGHCIYCSITVST